MVLVPVIVTVWLHVGVSAAALRSLVSVQDKDMHERGASGIFFYMRCIKSSISINPDKICSRSFGGLFFFFFLEFPQHFPFYAYF